jgi:hypothetical protein
MICTADTFNMTESNGNWKELTEGEGERELTVNTLALNHSVSHGSKREREITDEEEHQ